MTLPRVSCATSLVGQGLGASFATASSLYFGIGLFNSLTFPSTGGSLALETAAQGVLLLASAGSLAGGIHLTDVSRVTAQNMLLYECRGVNQAFDTASKRVVAASVAIPLATAIVAHITKSGPEIMAYGAGTWAVAQAALTTHGIHAMTKAENWLRGKCGMAPL